MFNHVRSEKSLECLLHRLADRILHDGDVYIDLVSCPSSPAGLVRVGVDFFSLIVW